MTRNSRDDSNEPPHPASSNDSPSPGVSRINVEDILKGARELILVHGGQDYRLRVTSNGKLILTK